MERPTHQGLRHLALNARDLDAMKHFYVELLGFSVEWEPDADNVYLTSGTDNLALHRAPSTDRPATPGALDHLGLVVRQADDVTHRQSRRYIDLDADQLATQAVDHGSHQGGKHARQRTVARLPSG